ncbi:exonuclease SbcCD subunit D [Paludicola sp. MB14-C6]|uniref:exonuclease SbcCD subunit D n=1 Tax=Paludihabitans sp. MB14-C6 TaxID=3070656 RepID=UPI0027DDC579|nr:exonuclease SbcCD subunit D [Paludicola sp. MB14-C6]WMJ23097.1 exonuclease SbcCD subunit D [Paludicola sp. MB14-C6]
MRIIHTADWHIGKILNDYSLLEDQKYYFDQFIAQLKELKPDALIIAGDLYDRSIPSSDAISLLNSILCQIILELKIKTFLISGNHDSKERLSFVGDLLSKSGLYIAGTLSKEIKKIQLTTQNNEIANFYLLPYIEPHNIKSIYPNQEIKTHNDAIQIYCNDMIENLDTKQINILIAHGFFQYGSINSMDEASVGGSDLVDAKSFSKFDYVALGHLHSARTIGNEKMRYSGSPLKYSIDEANQKKSYTIVDITNEGLEITTKEIKPLRDVRIVEGSFDYLSNKQNHINTDDYVFANITDEQIALHAITILKGVFPNILGLKYINLESKNVSDNLQSHAELKEKSNADLFKEFYHNAMDDELDLEQMQYIETVFKTLKGEQDDTD